MVTINDIIGKPNAQQAAPQQATETTAQAAAPQAGVATQVADTPVTNTAAAPAANATQQTTQATQTATQPVQQNTRPMSYADLFVAMNPYKPMTPEERAAEAKRNRRNAMFAAISDGISALSNLYFTTKGAPNSFNGGSTLSGKMYERQRQLEKEREAMDKDYINGYLRAMEMDRNASSAERNYRMQLENLKLNREKQEAAERRAEAKEERDKRKHDLDVLLLQGRISEQDYKTRNAKIESEYARAISQGKVDAQVALANQRNASADASKARAENIRSNGGGSTKKDVKDKYAEHELPNSDEEVDFDSMKIN